MGDDGPTSALCDAELAGRMARGDAVSFGVVFDRYAQDVYQYCWRHAVVPALGVDAEDLMSVVFLATELDGVLAVIDRLSAKERRVLELCAFEGLSTAVVAQLLGVPEGTVKSRLARARARLRSLGHVGEPTDPARRCGHEQDERAPHAPVPGGHGWTR